MLVTGILVTTLGAAMLIPALVDLAADNPDWMIFASSAMATMLVGSVVYAANARHVAQGLSTRQAMLMTVVVWLALVAFGALPFHWSGIVPSYTDAFFESMSGLTTTGATVITGLDHAPPGHPVLARAAAMARRAGHHRDGDRRSADAADRRHAAVQGGGLRHAGEDPAARDPDLGFDHAGLHRHHRLCAVAYLAVGMAARRCADPCDDDGGDRRLLDQGRLDRLLPIPASNGSPSCS
jgi:hypothetical protein